MGRRRRRLLSPGTGRPPRVLPSALGPGKPSEDDLLRAYRSISFDMDPVMKAGGFTRAAAGTGSSYSVLTLTVVTRAGTAK
jgi:hypothetical protein